MGILRSLGSGVRVALGTRCIVGRSAPAELLLQQATVSAQHASVYYYQGCWKVRDLASRNGTLVDGDALAPGEVRALQAGNLLSFGAGSEKWVLESDAPPGPSARRADGTRCLATGSQLLLPDAEQPEVSVTLQGEQWLLEGDFPTRYPRDGETLRLGGTFYELELPPAATTNCEGQTQSTRDADARLELRFFVDAAEEHVSIDVLVGGRVSQLGARAHNYPLLLLARQREQDRAVGQPRSEAGWLYTDQLATMLRADRKHLNQLLWRAKQSFERLGVPALLLIERRVQAGQLRLGPERVQVLSPGAD